MAYTWLLIHGHGADDADDIVGLMKEEDKIVKVKV